MRGDARAMYFLVTRLVARRLSRRDARVLKISFARSNARRFRESLARLIDRLSLFARVFRRVV